jgi:hypothetical protein
MSTSKPNNNNNKKKRASLTTTTTSSSGSNNNNNAKSTTDNKQPNNNKNDINDEPLKLDATGDVKKLLLVRSTEPENANKQFRALESELEKARKIELASIQELKKKSQEIETKSKLLNDENIRLKQDLKLFQKEKEDILLQLESEKNANQALLNTIHVQGQNSISHETAQRMFRLFEIYKMLTGFLIVNDEQNHSDVRIQPIFSSSNNNNNTTTTIEQSSLFEFKGHVTNNELILKPVVIGNNNSNNNTLPENWKMEQTIKINNVPAYLHDVMDVVMSTSQKKLPSTSLSISNKKLVEDGKKGNSSSSVSSASNNKQQ